MLDISESYSEDNSDKTSTAGVFDSSDSLSYEDDSY